MSGKEPLGCIQTGCLSLVVLVPSLNMTLPNEIVHGAQERSLLLEVELNNSTVLNMFWDPV